MQNSSGVVVIIGTGGTIAGAAARPDDLVGYTSGALGADALVAAVPALASQAIEAETLARLDSSDMDHATWAALRERAAFHLARAEVAAVVVTHGTDTLEETAYFLQRTLAAPKPLVLTAAMRPATALSADGPQNLLDAVTVARQPGARGVLAVLAGRVHAARATPDRWRWWKTVVCAASANGPMRRRTPLQPCWATRRNGRWSISSAATLALAAARLKPWWPPAQKASSSPAPGTAACTSHWTGPPVEPLPPGCRCGAPRAACSAAWSERRPTRCRRPGC